MLKPDSFKQNTLKNTIIIKLKQNPSKRQLSLDQNSQASGKENKNFLNAHNVASARFWQF